MILTLDVGNSQIYGGVFAGEELRLTFRRSSKYTASSDETGIFLRAALRENGIDPSQIDKIGLCSVVPDAVYSLRGGCNKYFGLEPFILQAGAKTGLKIRYRNPVEVGADRIANSIAATHMYPNTNLIIIDFGTATTFDAVTKEREYLGGSIVAGIKLCMEALEEKTAKLPAVEIVPAAQALGRSTIESIQSGLYFGNLGAVREICARLQDECFGGEKPTVIGTGGFSHLYERERLFHALHPELVLRGVLQALGMNCG